MNWYQKTIKSVLLELEVNFEKGLSNIQAEERLKTSGPNILASKKKETLFRVFLKQFRSPLIYILIFAEGVVPGDILILHEGDRVAADARIIKSESLTADESTLTGEAYPVPKISDVIIRENLVVGDQRNMLFSGTSVSSGYGEAIVVSTGLNSELGKISKDLLETSGIPLPLEKKVQKLSHQIAIAVAAIAGLVFVSGLLRNIQTREIFGAVVGLSVSIIPEGLPVVVTIVLARGVWRMAKAKAIVRQMAAVEAMGSADTLLVDKTGTITTGNMLIKQIFLDTAHFTVGGVGYIPQGDMKG